ncbi:MAG TPA: tRNA (adenosine(37)-N6)-threonylcarbamoyltransferase complex ATPase subunit type 1 TsaE [Gammaproteobacteria bacterium]|nr:tRNA (adenosine(37)-N6)-threonylcarbamoyltransferase complex ATPase subunit type 1 TsaE [Gammaproteobacteria bacterium]
MNLLINDKADLSDVKKLADECASCLLKKTPVCIHVSGVLGSGKTTFIQFLMSYMGVSSPVTSPTFSMVEEYELNEGRALHMDLYRTESVLDLESLGVLDVWDDYAVICIEWPENSLGYFPKADLHVELTHVHSSRNRQVRIQGLSEKGESIIHWMRHS